jgi:UDP-N-acetylmuramoyl-L-alanyl-D-glutamate--2,6-diaminopimelate ligase
VNIHLQKLKEALGELLMSCSGSSPEKMPERVTNDSRDASEKSLFCAIKGSLSDGHNFIESAISAGSKVIVCEDPQSYNAYNCLCLTVSDSYSAYAKLAEFYQNYPADKLTLAGITGTNGKTTTAYLLRSILNSPETPCGLISTVEYSTGGKVVLAERTTPDAVELQKLFSGMNDSGCRYGVMEVSSHALDQNRIGSAKFAVAIFANLTGDHLDYHNSMESYFQAKKVLFDNHIADNGYALINIDDPFGRELYDSYSESGKAFSYGQDKTADFRIDEISLSVEKTNFTLKLPDNDKVQLTSPLCGRFNTYNIAAAASAAYLLKITPSAIQKGIADMQLVPGRMERCATSPLVFVDYAHTDDALENILSTVSELLGSRTLTVIFGCGGDRDRTKRGRMGAVAAKFADKIVVTSDNPRTEDPDAIIKEIISGIPDNSDCMVISDRAEAIETAIKNACKNDVIVIAGKGHENYQEINGQKYPFDDRETVCKYIHSENK